MRKSGIEVIAEEVNEKEEEEEEEVEEKRTKKPVRSWFRMASPVCIWQPRPEG